MYFHDLVFILVLGFSCVFIDALVSSVFLEVGFVFYFEDCVPLCVLVSFTLSCPLFSLSLSVCLCYHVVVSCVEPLCGPDSQFSLGFLNLDITERTDHNGPSSLPLQLGGPGEAQAGWSAPTATCGTGHESTKTKAIKGFG